MSMCCEAGHLKEFARLLSITLHNTDGLKWPIRAASIITPVSHLFSAEYKWQMEQLTQKFDAKQWSGAFPNTLSLWRFSHHVINGLENADVSKRDIARFLIKLLSVIESMMPEHFLDEGSHITLSNDEILECTKEGFRLNSANSENLLRLAALLWAYSDAVYFQGREVCCEYHGPYIQNGNLILVRDFKNFYPFDLWPEIHFSPVYDSIRLITAHSKTLRLYFDAYNNISVCQGSFAASLLGGILYIDGQKVDADAINDLIREFTAMVVRQTKYVNSMSQTSLFDKYVQLFWYRKKYLAEYIGSEWFPPDTAFNIVRTAHIQETAINPLSKMSLKEIENMYDYSSYL